jgi:alpha-glucosidase (family GH31 glycosyl hydrolase)
MPLPPVPEFKPLPRPEAVVQAGPARFTVLADRLVRMEYSPEGRFEDRPSQVFWFREQPVPDFEARRLGELLEIETEFLLLRYCITPRGFQRSTLSIRQKGIGVTWCYGDSLRRTRNLKGTARTLDMDSGSTRLEDGLLSRRGWSVVNDSASLVFNENGWLEPRPVRQTDLYFFGYGRDHAACLRDYTRVAGPVPLIPRFLLGNWWSRYWAYSQAELQSLMEDFRAHEVPLSICIVDMDWHITRTGNSSDGWTGYTWNRELFPDPDGFIRWLHDQGLKTALNLHPARGVHPHEAQYAAMAEWMGVDPESKAPIPFDLTDPRFAEGYFEILHHPYEQAGVDFWWIDWQQGRRSRMPGLDPLWWLNHLHYQDLGRDGRKRPFVFSRWGGLGNHRYPIGFSGDTFVQWRSLAFQPYFTATAANVGYGWWSHDIGGHMFQDRTPELYLRWVQFGVFSPILRLHSTSKPNLDRRPWGKPERVFQAARAAMQLRHALIPYLYSMAWRCHRTGLAPVTPMYYSHPDEPSAYRARDQYWFGTELVAAPFLKPAGRDGLSRRRVWLPDGQWTDFFSGETLSGGWQTVRGALERIPVFARAGAIVPLGPRVGWGGIGNPAELDIHVFPGAENAFELYEDDGETTSYQQGEHALTPMSLSRRGEAWVFRCGPVQGNPAHVPSERTIRLHLRGVGANVTASLSGAYDPAARSFVLQAVRVVPAGTLEIEFHLEES